MIIFGRNLFLISVFVLSEFGPSPRDRTTEKRERDASEQIGEIRRCLIENRSH